MQRVITWLVVTLCVFLPTTLAARAQKDAAKPAAKAQKEPKEKPVSKFKGARPDVVGRLLRVEGAQRYITVQVTYRIGLPNPSAAINIANLQKQLINNRDRNSIMNIQM